MSCPWEMRQLSSPAKCEDDIKAMLSKPSWSVKTLFEYSTSETPEITQSQLHHLLRLSALPLPSSNEQEAKMISDLQSQLRFVRSIQEGDTEGVEPLVALRDETKEAEKESEITLESLKAEFEKEEVVGRRGRIRRRENTGNEKREKVAWDPIERAGRKLGRYVVVDTAKD
ncbi:hypothetical protein MMC21_002484 [Puttea exsequens]|nr:hypothetical protein [Puttea exsequens]